MIGDGRVLAVPARAAVSGNPLALVEYLDRIGGDARLYLLAGKAIGNRIIMPFDLDVVIQPGTPDTSFGKDIALDRQGPQSRTIKLFEQLTTGNANPAQDSLVVEVAEQFGDRRIDLGQTVEDPSSSRPPCKAPPPERHRSRHHPTATKDPQPLPAAASRAPSTVLPRPEPQSICGPVLVQNDISVSRGHAASPVSPQASRSFLVNIDGRNFTPAEHPRHIPAKGGGIISGQGGDYFSEWRGEIISESGGGLPRNLHS